MKATKRITVLSTLPILALLAGCGAATPGAEVPVTGPVEAKAEMKAGDPGSKGESVLRNGTFDEGTAIPWSAVFTPPASGESKLGNKELCVDVKTPGRKSFDIQVRQRPIPLKRHHEYTLKFKAHSTIPVRIRPTINAVTPKAELWSAIVSLETTPQVFGATFKLVDEISGDGEVVIELGGALAGTTEPYTVCLDDIALEDPEFTRPQIQPGPPRPKVLVNQVGYFPGLDKRATVKNSSPQSLDWKLLDASGGEAAKGKTEVFGEDKDAGEFVHTVDFSSFKTPGEGYVLEVAGEKSVPFDIRNDIYSDLKYEALAFFYHNRSGVAIKMPYAKAERWTRPAGHLGDKSVPCGEGTGCDYSLDVSGGWYDAGDHGKYVVNGGISVWTLLNLWERFQYSGKNKKFFADKSMAIPEAGNNRPDLLDEVKWELDWMMKMQVPEGKKLAGMVHHKMHDVKWTPIPTRPDKDPEKRTLRRPSTAATLNMAANAAQGARVWRSIDAAYSNKLLAAAEKAWVAAKANPAVYAPGDDGTGGGPYGDVDVTDEFYWAAAELFVTTGKPEYLAEAKATSYYLSVPISAGGGNSSMAWARTQALGTISMALVPCKLPKQDVEKARKAVEAAADDYAADRKKLGYRVPFQASGGRFPWGSNSFVINNALILGLAYDFTQKADYLEGVVDAMDYLLGRNPLAQSYVSGYGEFPLLNPHHRFWAKQADPEFPEVPPGVVSGGPNSGLEDPWVQKLGLGGCSPQQCFLDHFESWSTNEIAINWNAPFAWIAAFLDDQGPTIK